MKIIHIISGQINVINFSAYLRHRDRRNMLPEFMSHRFTSRDVFLTPNLKAAWTLQKISRNLSATCSLKCLISGPYAMTAPCMI